MLVEYAKTLQLSSPEDVVNPPLGSMAVDGLNIEDGWMCERCMFACPSELNMKEHCKREHGWMKRVGQQWVGRKVQTWFNGPNRRYFVVTTQIAEASTPQSQLINDWIDELLAEASAKDKAEDELLGVVDADQHMVDKSPWMRRTGWLWEFAEKDMVTIVKNSWRPTKEELGLQLIWRSG